MTGINLESSFGAKNRRLSLDEHTLPVFGGISKLLVYLSIGISLTIAGLTSWLGLPMTTVLYVSLTVFAGLGLMSLVVIQVLSRRVHGPLKSLVGEIKRALAGHYDDSTMVDNRQLPILNDAFNQLITSLVLAKEAMIDRDMLQRVLDGVPDPLVVLDGNGVVELSNKKFNERLQFADELSIIGKGVGTLSGQNMPSWYMDLIRHGALIDEPVDFKTTEGETISLLLSGTMIQNTNDHTSRVVLLARSSEHLSVNSGGNNQQSERREQTMGEFQNLFDAIEDPITVLSLSGEILQANRAARSMFGRQVVGQKCYRAFRMRDSMCEQCPAKMTYEKKKSAFVEHRIFGNAITRINTYPLFDGDGDVRAIINHKRDVTMERQLEDLKANFLAGVSHELRTPLTSIIGFNKLNLKRMARHLSPYLQTAPHKIRITFRQIMDDMQVMVSESERLGRLVNDILDLSKLEAGRMDMNFTEVHIGQIIQSAIASTSALWRAKGLRVHAAEKQDTPACWADSDRLIQVLMNLLSNAIKFTDTNDITVMTSVSRWHICVSVRDSGPGISPEDQDTIFEKFRQTTAGQKRGGGTGLGLPICRELIQLHKGKLWVDSVPGEGATFSFTILRADRRNESQQEQDEASRTSFSGQWVQADLDALD
jgi:signal transduction histidine kinase